MRTAVCCEGCEANWGVMGDIRDEEGLRHLFGVAQRRFAALCDGEGPRSDDYDEQLAQCCAELEQCAITANQLQLFSLNESFKDINTSNLRYLLLPFMIAQLHTQTRSLENRADSLRSAVRYFRNFLSICREIEVVEEEVLPYVSRILESSSQSSENDEDGVFASPEGMTREEKRDQLIAFTRREKANKAMREEIDRRRAELQSGIGSGAEDDLDEMERQVVKSQIDDSIMKAVKEHGMVLTELPMLEHMEKLRREGDLEKFRADREKEQAHIRRQAQRAAAAARDGQGGGSSSSTYSHMTAEEAAALGLRLFQVPDTNVRQRLLRPWWNQPTMSIEELAEIEMQNMLQGGASTEPAEPPPDQDDEMDKADDDEAIQAERDNDDFKDTHPTGWGNRINQG